MSAHIGSRQYRLRFWVEMKESNVYKASLFRSTILRKSWLALGMCAAIALGTYITTSQAEEIRFQQTDDSQVNIETRQVQFPPGKNETELAQLLEATLDHSHRKIAEQALDGPIYVAQRPFEPFASPKNQQPGQTETTPDASAPSAKSGAALSKLQQPAQNVQTQPAQSDQKQPALTVQTQPVQKAQPQPTPSAQAQPTPYASEYTNAASQRVTTIFSSTAYGSPAVDAAGREKLAVDDVREFSEQKANPVEEIFKDGAYLEEINGDIEMEEKLEAVTFDEIADECFFALDPYSSLFIEYEPTAEWTNSVLQYVQDSLGLLGEPSESTRAVLAQFGAKIAEADVLREVLIADNKVKRDVNEETPRLLSRYTLEQRLELLDAFKYALQRRVFLWTACVDYFQAREEGKLVQPRDLTNLQILELLRKTSEVSAFFGDTPNGRNWRASFDVDLLADDLVKVLELQTAVFEPIDEIVNAAEQAKNLPDDGSLSSDELEAIGKPLSRRDIVQKERARRMRFLRDRINSVAYKLEKTPMTPEQRQVFKRPTLAAWAALATSYSCDQANGRALLYEFERYENTGGGQSGRALQQLALRMATSRSEPSRQLGRVIDVVYDNPNVKAYVSEALINRLLPIRDPEFGVVQERILNNPVAGSRRVDTFVSIDLVPDPNRLLMNLTVNGRVTSSTSSPVFSATVHNQSYANYVGKKALEWRDSGLVYSAANVAADSISRLDAVETEVDFVPLVGGLAREVVRTSYGTKQEAIRAQTRAKVAKEARERIDAEANERFDALNARMRANFFTRLSNLGLSLRTQRSKTTDDWLLASLRLGSDYSLGGQTTEPATLDGAFADFKLHESSLNSYLAQLELGGRETSPRETLNYLAYKLDRPQLRNVQIEETDLRFTFAKVDPVVVRFFEDQIQLRLKFAKMALGEQEWDDLEVVVTYRPKEGGDAHPALERDGVVEIYGPTNIRSLLPLRAIFCKIFPAQNSFELKPELFQKDERFAGLSLGLCRVSRGWFAISVVRNDLAL